jgi:outer membrane protein
VLAVAVGVLGAVAAGAGEAQNWLARVRGIYVVPTESADISAVGGDVDIDNCISAELDLTYFIDSNWAVELMAGTTRHSVKAEGTAAGDVDLGSVWLLPPTLTLQYHLPVTESVDLYVGAGGNYTVFYDDDLPRGIVRDIDYDNAFGFVMQAGIDFNLTEQWVLNLDVKKILLKTDVDLNNRAIKADVVIDPWIFGVGVGYRF